MKRLIALSTVVLLALSLVACAGTTGPKEVKVKCPACGYEFMTPVGN